MDIVAWLVVGLIAGWLASQVMRGGGYGLVGDIIVGIVGAVIVSQIRPLAYWLLDTGERIPLVKRFAHSLRLFYEGRLAEATGVFETIAADDPPAAAYVVKCRAEAEKPHAGPWTGVWTMTEK